MRSPLNGTSSRNNSALSKYRPFCYDNLSEDGVYVRLLKVHPKRKGQPLRCDLQTVDLTQNNDRISYSALSYAWGLSREQQIILVNGKTLKVHSNLYSFLDTAATSYSGLPLWIDAICIDQNNLLERNHQVQLMNAIYSRAETVLLWLGKTDELLLQGFEALSHCCVVHPVVGNDQWDQFDEYFWHYENLFEQLRAGLWNHIYWTRVWVVQEILLGNPRVRVLYGHHNIPWDVFVRVIEILSVWENRNVNDDKISHSLSSLSYPCPTRFVKLCSTYHGVPDSVSTVLEECSMLDCADKRDRVYGILSLLPDGTSFPVDYQEDRFDLFCRFCTHFDLWHSSKTVAILFSGLIGSTLYFGIDLSPNEAKLRPTYRCRKKKVHLSPSLPTQAPSYTPTLLHHAQNVRYTCDSCGLWWPTDSNFDSRRPSFTWCSKPCEVENLHTHLLFQSTSNTSMKMELAAVIVSKTSTGFQQTSLLNGGRSSQQELVQSPREHACLDLTELHVGRCFFTHGDKGSFDCPSSRCGHQRLPNDRIQVIHTQDSRQTSSDIAESFLANIDGVDDHHAHD